MILNYLCFIVFYFFKNDVGSIEIERNFSCLKYSVCWWFVWRFWFNIVVLLYNFNFVNGQLNDMNVIVLILDSNGVSKTGVNVCVLKFGICNVIYFKDLILLCDSDFGRYKLNFNFLFKLILIVSMGFDWINLKKSISMNDSLMSWFKSMFVES